MPIRTAGNNILGCSACTPLPPDVLPRQFSTCTSQLNDWKSRSYAAIRLLHAVQLPCFNQEREDMLPGCSATLELTPLLLPRCFCRLGTRPNSLM